MTWRRLASFLFVLPFGSKRYLVVAARCIPLAGTNRPERYRKQRASGTSSMDCRAYTFWLAGFGQLRIRFER